MQSVADKCRAARCGLAHDALLLAAVVASERSDIFARDERFYVMDVRPRIEVLQRALGSSDAHAEWHVPQTHSSVSARRTATWLLELMSQIACKAVRRAQGLPMRTNIMFVITLQLTAKCRPLSFLRNVPACAVVVKRNTCRHTHSPSADTPGVAADVNKYSVVDALQCYTKLRERLSELSLPDSQSFVSPPLRQREKGSAARQRAGENAPRGTHSQHRAMSYAEPALLDFDVQCRSVVGTPPVYGNKGRHTLNQAEQPDHFVGTGMLRVPARDVQGALLLLAAPEMLAKATTFRWGPRRRQLRKASVEEGLMVLQLASGEVRCCAAAAGLPACAAGSVTRLRAAQSSAAAGHRVTCNIAPCCCCAAAQCLRYPC